MPGAVERRLDRLAKLLLAFVERAVLRGGENLHAQAASAADDAFGFQARIGLADRHRIDRALWATCRTLGSRSPSRSSPPATIAMDLIHDLPVNRHAGGRIDLENDG